MSAKEIKFNSDARSRMLAGVETMATDLKESLGTNRRNL